jgi:hypothetical protein
MYSFQITAFCIFIKQFNCCHLFILHPPAADLCMYCSSLLGLLVGKHSSLADVVIVEHHDVTEVRLTTRHCAETIWHP